MYSLEKEGKISEQEIIEEIVLPSETSPMNIQDKMKEVSIQDLRKDELSLETEPNIQEKGTDERKSVSNVSLTNLSLDKNTLNIPTQWSREQLLGSGGYGKVYLCRDSNTSSLFAVKQVELGNMKDQVSKEVQALINEIQILSKIQHKRIVQYYGCQEDDVVISIFLEYMPGGSLHQHIHLNGVLTEALTSMYTKQILEGLVFLHANKIVHRDLKAANILRNTDRNIKLTDFGVSKQLHKISTATGLNTTIGTPYWMAPEIIKENGYGQNADLWSLGCTVVEMLTTNPPFYDLEPFAAIFKIGNCEHPEYTLPAGTSDSVKNFLKITFQLNSSKRTSAQRLLQHRFITDQLIRNSLIDFKRPFKIVTLGSMNVGKSCLLHRYFSGNYEIVQPTIGFTHKIKMWGPYRAEIYDISGLFRMQEITGLFCKDASAAILFFALNSSESFDILKTHFQPLLESVNTDCLKVLVGTIRDDENRQVTFEEGTNYARELNKPDVLAKLSQDPYFETSSKKNENVNEVFEFIFQHCLPPILTVEEKPEQRKTKSFLDFLFHG